MVKRKHGIFFSELTWILFVAAKRSIVEPATDMKQIALLR